MLVHLVNMPFADITSPSLALGLLKTELVRAGFAARAFYPSIDLSVRMGFKPYRLLAQSNVPISEWLFAAEAWPQPRAIDDVDELLAQYGFEPPPGEAWARKKAELEQWRRDLVPAFLDACVEQLAAAGEPRLVAFSCTFFQTLPALALGRRLKARYPQLRTVYGGASFHDEVGVELIEKAPFIDAVCTGEADDTLVPLFRALAAGEPPAGLPGIHYRDRHGVVHGGAPGHAVDAAAYRATGAPDFDEFFAAAAAVGLDADPGWRREVVVPFESSRGCWWGEKAHCTFCGLNGHGMDFRVRDSGGVRAALQGYLARYPARRLHAADNLIAMDAFHDLLPALAAEPLGEGVELFYHVKSNFRREQLEALAAAGVTDVGPGIESLSTHLLQLMRKGVTALQNVQFLKCCAELGLKPRWTNLIRVPGEQAEDYRQMEDWIPKVVHLSPPSGAGEIQLHRFSPYQFEDRGWVRDMRPHGAYRALYPESHVALEKVAYVFEADWQDCLPAQARAGVVAATAEWRRRWMDPSSRPRLALEVHDGTAMLIDTRGATARRQPLDGDTLAVYRAMQAPVGERRLLQAARAHAPGLAAERVRAIAQALVERADALAENGRYLALATVSAETVAALGETGTALAAVQEVNA